MKIDTENSSIMTSPRNVQINDTDDRKSMPISASPGNLLHAAIAANDWPECKRLIELYGAAAATAKNQRGTNPLMLAADGKCGRNNAALLDALLTDEAGGALTAAERNRKGKTAADIANNRGSTVLSKKLRALEAQAISKEVFKRCPHCYAKLRPRPKLAFLEDRVSRGEEDNPLILELFADKSSVKQLCRVEYHRINSCVSFRKELTESLALIYELKKIVSSHWEGLHIIDLCSGSSMTGSLALNLLPGCFVTAVDIVGSDKLPHFDKLPNISEGGLDNPSNRRFQYIQDDINSPELLKKLKSRITSLIPKVNVVLAMHCCGTLSIKAIHIFNELNCAAALIMPCCLPPKTISKATKSELSSPPLSSLSDKDCIVSDNDLAWIYKTNNQESQYKRWAEFLCRYCGNNDSSEVCENNNIISTLFEVPAVLSPRCMMISVMRRKV